MASPLHRALLLMAAATVASPLMTMMMSPPSTTSIVALAFAPAPGTICHRTKAPSQWAVDAIPRPLHPHCRRRIPSSSASSSSSIFSTEGEDYSDFDDASDQAAEDGPPKEGGGDYDYGSNVVGGVAVGGGGPFQTDGGVIMPEGGANPCVIKVRLDLG